MLGGQVVDPALPQTKRADAATPCTVRINQGTTNDGQYLHVLLALCMVCPRGFYTLVLFVKMAVCKIATLLFC